MSGRPLLLLIAATMSAAPALAKVPSAANSTLPTCITLVGSRGGMADPCGQFTVVIRDLANNPEAGDVVLIDFSQSPNARISTAQSFAGEIADCTLPSVRAVTDAQGAVTFRIVGSGRVPGGSGNGVARISADGVTLRINVPVHAYDLDGYNGVDGNDLSLWMACLFSGTNNSLADYDCSGTLGANDLSLWLAAKWASGSTESAAPVCGP